MDKKDVINFVADFEPQEKHYIASADMTISRG
jgi:hypothetical protein